jgi:ATP-dependent DNA ligase
VLSLDCPAAEVEQYCAMSLPLLPPIEPMLARSSAEIPPGLAYEPKWDGFRCLVFRDETKVLLFSRNGRDLTAYFPEVVAAALTETPPRCVLDGELVVARGDRLDFDLLSDRIHPAESRIRHLAAAFPASLICWDLLALDDDVLLDRPFGERREMLRLVLSGAGNRVHLTPLTVDLEQARQWMASFEGAGLDGIVAKSLESPYQPGKRAMIKIKHAREADVVVAGYRLHRNSTTLRPLLGSLQLGLFDSGILHYVGVAAAFSEPVRAELAERFAELEVSPDSPTHPWAQPAEVARLPGAVSRWSSELKQTSLIEPLLVCTVGYEHMQGQRFRHSAQFKRWRPDREPASCTYDQLDEIPNFDLAKVLSGDI